MTIKRFPEKDYNLRKNSYQEALSKGDFQSIPELVPQTAMNYSAPSVIPPRKGKKIAILIVSILLGYGAYSFWNNYFRYDSFGIVESQSVGIFSPIPGFIEQLNTTEGMILKKGDSIATVVNSDDQRALEKIDDEIILAQSELNQKRNEIHMISSNHLNSFYELKGQLDYEQGILNDLKLKLIGYNSNLSRMNKLKNQDSASDQEIESAKSLVLSTKSLIQSKVNIIDSLKSRIKESQTISQINLEEDIIPIQNKINSLVNEKNRLLDKIKEGKIVSPINGIVSLIQKHKGEKVIDESILEVVVENTAQLVLYYDPADKIPNIGDHVQVVSNSQGKMIDAKVIAISKNVVSPAEQVKRNYSADQKLVKVYMEPVNVDINSFVVGSIIKRPKLSDIFLNIIKVAEAMNGENTNE